MSAPRDEPRRARDAAKGPDTTDRLVALQSMADLRRRRRQERVGDADPAAALADRARSRQARLASVASSLQLPVLLGRSHALLPPSAGPLHKATLTLKALWVLGRRDPDAVALLLDRARRLQALRSELLGRGEGR